MAIYRNVHLTFWTDNKIVDDFTPEDRYFYLFLLTNPQTNICGCYEISIKQFESQLGYTKDIILKLLERFEKVHNVIRYNSETKEILILNWHKYNYSKSEKVIKGVRSAGEHIKCEEYRKYVLYIADCMENGEKNIEYIYSMVTSDTDTDTDTNTNTLEVSEEIVNSVNISNTKDMCKTKDISSNKKKSNTKSKGATREVYFPNDEKLDAAFREYVKMRQAIKKPFATDSAIDLSMEKLKNLSGGDNEKAIAILNNSVMNSWQGLFEPKEYRQNIPRNQNQQVSFADIMNMDIGE